MLVVLIVIGSGGLLVLLIGMTVRQISAWTGVWRVVVSLPLLSMAGLIGYMLIHPASAGLWPIVIVFWGTLALLALAAIVGVHALIERFASRSKSQDD